MRTVLALAIVVAIVTAFTVFNILLPRWRTGEEKTPLVTGTVVASPEQLATGPVTFYVELFQGPSRRVPSPEAQIDDDAPPPTFGPGEPPTSYRFSLAAGPADGPRFFVRASVELTTFERFCADVELPPLRVVDGDWVVARTGRPPAPLRLAPTTSC